MRRAKKIRVLLMDVDGTMTPRVVCLQSFPDGSVAEMKVFNAHDGAGIKLASIMGIRTGLITGRDSPATARRAREMGMEFVYQGQPKKLESYKAILVTRGRHGRRSRLHRRRSARSCRFSSAPGLAVAVADAVVEVKRAAHYITTVPGGRGAAAKSSN